MFRFVIACVFYTTVARWGYSEISLMFPSAVPYINQAVSKIQIPTHNNWSRDTVYDYVDTIGDTLSDAEEAIRDIENFVSDRSNNQDNRHIG